MQEHEGSAAAAEELREYLERFLGTMAEGDPDAFAKLIFREDGEFSELLVRSYPHLFSAAVQMVRLFAESLDALPAEESADLLGDTLSRIDGREIGEAVNSVAQLIIQIHEKDPDLYPQKRLSITAGAVDAIDFGKLRKAVNYRVQERLDLLRNEVELMGNDPIALINLFSVVTPLLNNLLRILSQAFQSLTLPAEALTYALFTILEDIDWKGLGQTINYGANFVNTLYRGDLLLGDGSPRFKEVAARISHDLVDALDGEVLAEVLVSLGDEASILVTSVAEAALQRDELVLHLSGALVSQINIGIGTVSALLEKLNALSPHVLQRIAGELEEGLDAQELGRSLGSLAALYRKLTSENPDLFKALLRDSMAAADIEPGGLLGPSSLGAVANRALESYNGLHDRDPRALARGLDAFLSELDPGQLDRAASSLASELSEAISRHPAAAGALIKALIAILYRALRDYLGSLRIVRRMLGKGV